MNSLRVLIVVDDHGLACGWRAPFEALGWRVDVEGSAGAGQRRLHGAHYDVAVLDLELPDREGERLLSLLHRTSLRPAIVSFRQTRVNCRGPAE